MVVGCLSEMIEAMGAHISSYVSDIMPIFLNACQDASIEVKTNALFGLGLICTFVPKTIWNAYATQAMQAMAMVYEGVQHEMAQKHSHHALYYHLMDNYCGALSRVILKVDTLDLAVWVPMLLSWLPLKKDAMENRSVISAIIYLLKVKQDQHVRRPLACMILENTCMFLRVYRYGAA